MQQQGESYDQDQRGSNLTGKHSLRSLATYRILRKRLLSEYPSLLVLFPVRTTRPIARSLREKVEVHSDRSRLSVLE